MFFEIAQRNSYQHEISLNCEVVFKADLHSFVVSDIDIPNHFPQLYINF